MKAPRGEWLVNILRAAVRNLRPLVVIVCFLQAMVLPAIADPLEAACQQTGQDKRHLECEVRFVTPREVTSVSATVVETNRTLPAPSFDRYPKSGELSAFLFLFDLSDPMRAATLSANITDAQRILRTAEPYDRFGIETSPGSGHGPAPSLDVLASIGSDPNTVERSFSNMRARGAPSSVYISSIDAIRTLAAFPAKRRALLLFTAGRSKGESYTLDDVVDEARRDQVAVFTFADAERASDARPLEPLVQLADRTGGRYFQADPANPHFASADIDTVLKHLDNGGRVSVDLSGVASGQTVDLAFSTTGTPSTLTHRVQVQDLAQEPSKEERSSTSAAPGAESKAPQPPAPGWFETATKWIGSHLLESALAGIAVLLLLLALIAYRASLRRNRAMIAPPMPVSQQQTTRYRPSVAPTVVAEDSVASIALASLQPVVSGGSPHLVRNALVTIGRASDCDIRLNDETVSAHHATLVHKRDGSFELTDMGSRNGVRVNGERVERRMVSNGDKIELGAAQFRFVLN